MSEQNTLSRHWESDTDEDRPRKDDASFSESALALVNAFLDQLLYSFLSQARSTSLSALRPAVAEVLKQRLAREAVASAEEELQEMLDGGEEEEDAITQSNAGNNNSRTWDLELVWKRTRLRVMVYMRLGEMEDDDEERYVKEDELFQNTERRFSRTNGLVSWASAIFLTSILEYVAEQTLQTAGKAADSRARRQAQARAVKGEQIDGQAYVSIVEEYDVEKVALSPTLGRLWRTWRKSLRNSNAITASLGGTPSRRNLRASSRDNILLRARSGSLGTPVCGENTVEGAIYEERPHTRSGSVSTVAGMGSVQSTAEDPEVPDVQHPEHVLAANIPLPMGQKERDIEEIEVPGLVEYPDESAVDAMLEPKSVLRRKSISSGMPPPNGTGTMKRGIDRSEANQKFREQPVKPGLSRQRSKSVPAAPISLRARRSIMPGSFPEEISSSSTSQSSKGATPPAFVKSTEQMEEKIVQPIVQNDYPTLPTKSKLSLSSTKRSSKDTAPPVTAMSTEQMEKKMSESRVKNDYPPLPIKSTPKPIVAGTDPKVRLPRRDSEKFDAAVMAPLKRKSQTDLSESSATTLQPDDTIIAPPPIPPIPTQSSLSNAELDDRNRRKSDNPATGLNPTIYGSQAKSVWNTSVPDLRAPSQPATTEKVRDVEELDKGKAIVGKEVKEKRLSMPTVAFSRGKLDGATIDGAVTRRSLADLGKGLPGVPIRDKSGEYRDFKVDDGLEVVALVDNDLPPYLHERSASGPMELEDTSVRGNVGIASTLDRTGGVFIPGFTSAEKSEQQHARDAAQGSTPPNAKTSSHPYAPGTIAAAAATAGLAAAGISGTVKGGANHGGEYSGADAFLQNRNLDGSGSSPSIEHLRDRARSSSQITHESPRLASRETRPNVPLTNGAQQYPFTVSNAPNRQSWSAATERQVAVEVKPKSTPSTPVHPKTKSHTAEVKDHPALQMIGSAKRNENKAALAALERGSRSNGSYGPALTSASIRGPEDFDMFVQGEDTVKYTLTPQNVRDQPAKPATYKPSYMPNNGQANEGARPPPQLTSLDTNTASSPRGRRSSSRNSTSTSVPSDPQATPQEKERRRRSTSRPSPRNTSSSRNGRTAREPQVMTESTRDFADFIRSTGPNKDQEVQPITNPANKSTTSLASSMRSVSTGASRSPSVASSRAGEDERSKSITKSAMIAQNIPPIPPMPAPGSSGSGMKKSGMQARAASGSQGGTNELIDFIRSGPEQPPGEHRIPRSVAPFRSTMDSDQFAGLEARGSREESQEARPPLRLDTSVGEERTAKKPASMASRSPTSTARARARSRTGASAAGSPAPAVMTPSGQPRKLSNRDYMATRPISPASLRGKAPPPTTSHDSPEPTRKRYRNKDPYAIDYSDDEDEATNLDDDSITALPRNTRGGASRREESLMDFLNSHEPPADNAPHALSSATSTTSRPAPTRPPALTGNSTTSLPKVPRPSSLSSNTTSTSAALKHAKDKDDIYRGPRMQARAAAAANPNSAAAKRLGAFHNSAEDGSNTRDLADFFRNSGPPEGNPGAPAPPSVGNFISGPASPPEKQRRGFWSSFGRKRSRQQDGKAGKKTWLDMP